MHQVVHVASLCQMQFWERTCASEQFLLVYLDFVVVVDDLVCLTQDFSVTALAILELTPYSRLA